MEETTHVYMPIMSPETEMYNYSVRLSCIAMQEYTHASY